MIYNEKIRKSQGIKQNSVVTILPHPLLFRYDVHTFHWLSNYIFTWKDRYSCILYICQDIHTHYRVVVFFHLFNQ